MELKLAAIQLDFVPSAVSSTSTFWTPSEPLFWRDQSADPSMTLSTLSGHARGLAPLREEILEKVVENQNKRLEQLLNFLTESEIDICVFPEYAFICEEKTVKLLNNYSSEMVIIAGLGLPRLATAALEKLCDGPVDPQMNTVGLFSRGGLDLITKKNASAGENIEKGTGARILPVTIRDHNFRVGVAICKDALLVPHGLKDQVTGEEDPIDILAVPALTLKVDEFVNDPPRDYPRIFANAAVGGQSTVLAAGLSGTYVNRNLVEPIRRGLEGIIAITWNGAPKAPTALLGRQNRVYRRAAILNESHTAEARDVVRQFGQHSSEGPPSRVADADSLDRWRDFLGTHDSLGLLADAVRKYIEAINDSVLSGQLNNLLQSHLVLAGVPSIDQQRIAALKRASHRIGSHMGEVAQASSGWIALHAALPAYATTGEVTAAPSKGQSKSLIRHFSIGLGKFDSEDAAATTPDQRNLLLSFASTAPPHSRIVHRLETSEVPATGQVQATYAVDFYGPDDIPSTEYFANFQRIARTVYVRGWGLYNGESEPLPGTTVQLVPADTLSARGPATLGVLVDVFRAMPGGVGLAVVAKVASDSEDGSSRGSGLELNIAIRLTTPDANRALASFVASTLLDGRTEIHQANDPEELRWVRASIDEAIEILHPPTGHIQGRGIARDRSLELPARDLYLPSGGASIGEARHTTAYLDTTTEIRLPQATRLLHTYVIGRTGAGKTNTLKNIVRYDLARPGPTIVIDPHGDLFDYAARHAMGEGSCVALNFSADEVPSVNPIYLDATTYSDLLLNIDAIVDQLVHSTHHEFAGPRFADLASLALETLLITSNEHEGEYASIADITTLFEDPKFREDRISRLRNLNRTDLLNRWSTHQNQRIGERSEIEQWFASKLSPFRTSQTLRQAVSGRPDVSLHHLLSTGTNVLVRIPVGRISAAASDFLGSLLVDRVSRLTLDSVFAQFDEPASLVVDEFQNYAGTSFNRLIPEARKFNLALTLANQTLNQLDSFSLYQGGRSSELVRTLLGNVGTIVIQSIGRHDAEILGSETAVPPADIGRIGKHSAVISMTVDGVRLSPFTAHLSDAAERPGQFTEAATTAAISAALKAAAAEVVLPEDELAERRIRSTDDPGVVNSRGGPVRSPSSRPDEDPSETTHDDSPDSASADKTVASYVEALESDKSTRDETSDGSEGDSPVSPPTEP